MNAETRKLVEQALSEVACKCAEIACPTPEGFESLAAQVRDDALYLKAYTSVDKPRKGDTNPMMKTPSIPMTLWQQRVRDSADRMDAADAALRAAADELRALKARGLTHIIAAQEAYAELAASQERERRLREALDEAYQMACNLALSEKCPADKQRRISQRDWFRNVLLETEPT